MYIFTGTKASVDHKIVAMVRQAWSVHFKLSASFHSVQIHTVAGCESFVSIAGLVPISMLSDSVGQLNFYLSIHFRPL